MMVKFKFLVFVLLSALALNAAEQRHLARLIPKSLSDYQFINQNRFIVDRVLPSGEIDLWVTDEEYERLSLKGMEIRYIPNLAKEYADSLRGATEGMRNPMAAYHDYQELTAFMDSIVAAFPAICQYYSIGQSVQGRELWVMKISDNVSQNEPEPEFKYIANMHGDEPPGKEICINLIRWLALNYGSNPRATNLVNSLQIYILPSMNPDGFESHSRFNANGVDLNRNFPDRIVDPVNTTEGREPETAAVMNWSAEHNFILSANFHTGALVANYPYDGNESGSNVYTPAPDDALFINLATEYAINNIPMYNSSYFPNGITNGADWYVIYGGMQDWNYVWMGDFEITVEVSSIKWPPVSQLSSIWNDNRESMLAYMEKLFTGIQGTVTDTATGIPVKAMIAIEGIQHDVFSDSVFGQYTRLALPGIYSLQYEAPGYLPKQVDSILVNDGHWTEVNVQLVPEGYIPPCVPGDVNADGLVNIMDVVQIVNYILGYIDLNEDAFCAADWNEDFNVDVTDIVGIVAFILNNNNNGNISR